MQTKHIDLVETSTPKSFVKWAGGKAKLLPEILKRVPLDYEEYFEPFLGGGSVFFALSPRKAFLIDINDELINTYQVVRDNPDLLINDLRKHIYEERYFSRIRGVDREPEYNNWNDIRKASRFIYLNKTCYNALYRVNSRNQFNTTFGRYTNPTILDEDTIRACSLALQNVELRVGDFRMVQSILTPKSFIYLDPPYMAISKSSSFTSYTPKGFNEKMQKSVYHFCRRLNNRGIKFMLSNSSSPFILDLYKSFNIEFVMAPRSINSDSGKRGKIPEVLVTNY